MVRDHAVGYRALTVGVGIGVVRGSFDQRAENIDGEAVVGTLQGRCDALEPHAGVDGRPRQIDPLFRRELLVLHEDQVPDLDKPVAILVGAARRSAVDARTVIVEYLRAGTTRPGVAHRPEIVRGGYADDFAVRQAGDLLPQRVRLVVF